MSLQGNQPGGISCLVDTDIIIDFLRRRDYTRDLLDNWSEEGLLAISVLTHLEIYHSMKSSEEKATNLLLDGLVSVSVDVSIARRGGKILRELRSRGVTVGIADSIIAATALQLGTPLLTNNVDHYPFSDLKVVRGYTP